MLSAPLAASLSKFTAAFTSRSRTRPQAVGNSKGGMISLMEASASPETVAALILADPTPLNLFRPFWVDDDNFEISNHVRHIEVPAPGGAEELRAFRDLLEHRGELTGDLVVRSLVPVSVRSQDERGVVTNRVSAVLVNLPVSEPDPRQRLALIREQMDSLKRTSQAVSAEILTGMLGFTGPLWLALGSRAVFGVPQPLLQTVVTNVPGPRAPLYILGRRMEAGYPYVPIGNSVRMSIAILSYLDTFSFGLTADYDAAPDLNVLLEGIGHGLAELGQDAIAI